MTQTALCSAVDQATYNLWRDPNPLADHLSSDVDEGKQDVASKENEEDWIDIVDEDEERDDGDVEMLDLTNNSDSEATGALSRYIFGALLLLTSLSLVTPHSSPKRQTRSTTRAAGSKRKREPEMVDPNALVESRVAKRVKLEPEDPPMPAPLTTRQTRSGRLSGSAIQTHEGRSFLPYSTT